jgi:phage tail-like protein
MKSRTLLACGLFAVVVGAAALVSSSQGAAGKRTEDAQAVARFAIIIDGRTIASFSELGGLTSGIDPSDLTLVAEGRNTQLALPGRRTPPAITLQRGMTSDRELWDWHEAVFADASARKDAQLVMYGADGTPVARYFIENAWPSKLEIGSLKAGSSEVLVEAVTIVSEHIRRIPA